MSLMEAGRRSDGEQAEARRSVLTTRSHEPHTPFGRFLLIAVLIIFACLIIFIRTGSLQLGGQEWENVELTRGVGSDMTIQAPRGDIVDSKGRPLAYTESSDSLYLAYSAMKNKELNKLLLDISELLNQYGIKPVSRLDNYFGFSEFASGDNAERKFVFKKDLDVISAWQQNKDLFNLLPSDSRKSARYKVKLDPADFYDYLLYDAFDIEDRRAKGNLFYSKEEAWQIMRLRYQILENNWTFVQGEPVKLAENIPADLKAKFIEQNQYYKGAVIKPESRRRYTDESRYFSHIIGYVGAISNAEYEGLKSFGYGLNDITGKGGVEYTAERYLHGKNGKVPYGSWIAGDEGKDSYEEGAQGLQPVPGATVQLAQDIETQKILYASLYDTVEYARQKKLGKGSSAAAVMLDLKTGKVLAMGSIPSFMPVDFMSAAYDPKAEERVVNDLKDNENKPMQNRCISEIYAPGSTFKPFSAAAAIMTGVITPEKNRYECKGKENIGYKNWVCFGEPIHGHGFINLTEGLVYSCNLYFFKMALDTGIEAISTWAKNFGLGEYSGIDLPGEAKGIRPSPELKAQTRMTAEDQEWYPADTCQTSIGQFDNAYTLIQLVRAVGAVCSNRLVTPHVIHEIRSADGTLIRPEQVDVRNAGLNETCLKMIRDGMRELKYYVKSNHTNRNFADYPVDVSAKTGTAEVGYGDDLWTNALFVCFAPTDNPEVAIACIVEQGGKGDVSSNIARDLLDAYYGFEPREAIQKRLKEMDEDPYRFFRNAISPEDIAAQQETEEEKPGE